MAKDIYHDLVKTALIEEGWKITHDPYYLTKDTKWQIDLGAEKMIGAEKEGQKIAVEVKTFLKASFSNEFHTVIGQYINYLLGLEIVDKDRILFLAVPSDIYKKYFHLESIQRSVQKLKVNIIVYNIRLKNIDQWIQYNQK